MTAPKVAPPETTTLPAEVPVKVTAPVPVNVPVLSQLPPTLNVLDPVTVPAPMVKLPVDTNALLKVCVPPVPLLSSEPPASVLISVPDSTRL